jgi:hypothetical protein
MEEREFERTIKASPAATTSTRMPMPMAKKKEPEVEEGKASTSTKERENPKVANADVEPWRKGFLLRANNEAVHRKPLADMEEQEHVLVCPLFQIYSCNVISTNNDKGKGAQLISRTLLTGIRIRKYSLEHITYDRYQI